jgi:demethylmenaquinone methyltransferase/2-methoxy-6-polyprenyl-1,4-benzoquinol methylase
MNDRRIVEYYAARAPEYDLVYAKPERQKDLRAIERWLPSRFTGLDVLEVACGTGYWTQFLAAEGRRIVAIDAAEETLAVARGRIGAPHVAFVVDDAYTLAECGGGFGASFAGFWLSHVPRDRQVAFLHNLHGRLDADATVVFLDNRYVPGSSSAIARRDADGNTYQTRRLRDGSTRDILKNFPTADELHALADAVGVRGRLTEWEHYWAFEYRT